MEYIYLHDKVWKNKTQEHREELVEIGIIVTDVIKDETTGGFIFTIKETGERRTCNYAWAFAENTHSNLERVKNFQIAKHEYLQAKRKMSKAFKNIITLERTQEEIRNIKLNELSNK